VSRTGLCSSRAHRAPAFIVGKLKSMVCSKIGIIVLLKGTRFSGVAGARPTSPLEAVVPYDECSNAVPNFTRLATMWRMGGLCSRGGAVSCNSTASGVLASLNIARRFHATSTATLKSSKSRVSLLLQRARSQFQPAIKSRSHRPASDRQAMAR